MLKDFIPKSYHHLNQYSFSFFKKDLVAGVTVGIIALPLAMAFAIASGTTPEKGLFTAIVAGFLISALGGSRVQIGGPTGAFVVLVYDIIQRHGYEGLAVSTLIASILLIGFGLFRLGTYIKFVPPALVTGFTSGIAVIVFSSQMRDFFGLELGAVPANFIAKWSAYAGAIATTHVPTLLLAGSALALILSVRKWLPKIPWGIAAIAVGSLVVWLFAIPVETVESRFGQIPSQLPLPSLPTLHVPEGKWLAYSMDAIAIAFLAGIESLLSAVIADKMIGGQHRPNCELVGQGIANFASILFGGIPATGAIARTTANVKSGAATPLSGMIHALVLLGIIWFLAPYASQIPLAALAAVLIMVAWNMAEISQFKLYLKSGWKTASVLLTAFFLTVFVDIVAAVIAGMLLYYLIEILFSRNQTV